MVSIAKIGKELHENLILRHGSVDNLGVETAVVNTLEVTSIKPSVSITIKFQESLVSYGLSLGVKSALFDDKGMRWYQ